MARKMSGIRQVTVYFPEAMHDAIRTKAFFERTSINQLVLAAVEQLLRKSPPPVLPAKLAAKAASTKRSKPTRKEARKR